MKPGIKQATWHKELHHCYKTGRQRCVTFQVVYVLCGVRCMLNVWTCTCHVWLRIFLCSKIYQPSWVSNCAGWHAVLCRWLTFFNVPTLALVPADAHIVLCGVISQACQYYGHQLSYQQRNNTEINRTKPNLLKLCIIIRLVLSWYCTLYEL